MSADKTYRGWTVVHVYPPIPVRTMDWGAYPEGEEEEGYKLFAETEEGVQKAIDLWIEENALEEESPQ